MIRRRNVIILTKLKIEEEIENLLKELNVINDKTGFYTAKYSKKVFQNEIDYLQTKKQDGIFMAIEPNKISRLSPRLSSLRQCLASSLPA